MAYAKFLPLLTAVREVLVGTSGALRAIPDTRFTDDLTEGLREEELARRGIVSKKPFRVRISEATTSRASPPTGGNLILYKVTVEVIVSRTIGTPELLSADKLAELEATQWEDADVIRQALETGPNLRVTSADAATDLASSALRWVRTRGRLVVSREPTAAQRYESVHLFGGTLKSRPGIVAAPVFTTSPAIYVAGGSDPEVGATLIADPGVVTGAHTERGQWMRDGVAIDGETGVTYELVEADQGASITYRATATGSGGTTTAESNAIEVGGEPPVTLESQIVAAFAAVSWSAHFVGLVRDEADVSLVGSAIAALFDRSGAANHAQQAATARPAYNATASNGHPGMVLDGTKWLITPAIDLGPATAAVLMVLMSDTDTAARIPVEWGTTGGASAAGGIAIVTNDGGAGGLGAYGRRDSLASIARSGAVAAMTTPAVVSATWDLALASNETEIRHAGTNVTATRPGNGNNTGTLGSAKLAIGARDGGAGMTGTIGGVVLAAGAGPITGDVLAAIATVEALLAASKGLPA